MAYLGNELRDQGSEVRDYLRLQVRSSLIDKTANTSCQIVLEICERVGRELCLIFLYYLS